MIWDQRTTWEARARRLELQALLLRRGEHHLPAEGGFGFASRGEAMAHVEDERSPEDFALACRRAGFSPDAEVAIVERRGGLLAPAHASDAPFDAGGVVAALEEGWPGAEVVGTSTDPYTGMVAIVIRAADVEGTNLVPCYTINLATGAVAPGLVLADPFTCEAGTTPVFGPLSPVRTFDVLRKLRMEHPASYDDVIDVVRELGTTAPWDMALALFPPPPPPSLGKLIVWRCSAGAAAVAAVAGLLDAERGRGSKGGEGRYQLARTRHRAALRALDDAEEHLSAASPPEGDADRWARFREEVGRIEAVFLDRVRAAIDSGDGEKLAHAHEEMMWVGGTTSGLSMWIYANVRKDPRP